MKGILLAGGSGTRLAPLTTAVSKQLLPVYDKPVIYYPLSALMLAGIKEVAVISTARDLPLIRSLLGDGKKLGMKFEYFEQPKPEGIAQAFLIAESFIKNEPVCLILGDNLFHANDLVPKLKQAAQISNGACVFATQVKDPERYGVVEVAEDGKAISIEEKPKSPKSNWAVTGLYFYDKNVTQYAKELKPSARGEYEITDINVRYMKQDQLSVTRMGRGFAWLDTGTFDSLHAASSFVKIIEERTGVKVGCIEEIAYLNKWISKTQLAALAEETLKSGYGQYLKDLAESES